MLLEFELDTRVVLKTFDFSDESCCESLLEDLIQNQLVLECIDYFGESLVLCAFFEDGLLETFDDFIFV